jgi:hypothetical protein
MGDGYMITDGRRTCFLELENVRVGVIASSNIWRQHKPFNKSLLENITGNWTYGDAIAYVERAPVGYTNRGPQLKLTDPNGRVIMEFQSLPGDDKPTTGDIIRPDGWRDKVTLSKMKFNVDLARAWMGLALKGGATAVLVGEEISVGSLWNLGTDQVGFPFVTTAERGGLGAGASGGLTLVFAYGFRDARAAVGTEFGGLDFSLSLGGRWSSWMKALRFADPKSASSIMRMVAALPKLKTPSVRSLAALMHFTSGFVHSEDAINLFKSVIGLSSFDDTTRTIVMFDVPFASGGLELAIFSASGRIVAVDMASAERYFDQLMASAARSRPSSHLGDPRRQLY